MRFAAMMIGALAVMSACTTVPRPLPAPLPTARSPIGNLILGDPQVPGQFEVIARAGDWTDEFMCSAGDYVQNTLGQEPARRVYVVRPLGASDLRPGRRSVVFTVTPSDDLLAAADVLSGDQRRSVGQPGESFRAASGAFTCNRILPYFWDLGGN